MSGPSNSRAYRQQVLKELITSLHDGKSVDEVKARFTETFKDVSALEISEAEQALIADGLPVSEVQRLCDVHASLFKGSIQDLHAANATGTGLRHEGAADNISSAPPIDMTNADASKHPGHPIHSLKLENRALEAVMTERIRPRLEALKANGRPNRMPSSETIAALRLDMELLQQVHLHYLKKENLLFPLLERNGITAPPKVMWGVDDEIRGKLKRAREALADSETPVAAVLLEDAMTQLEEMIFKEENILMPMCLDVLKPSDWQIISQESGEIGWALISTPPAWTAETGLADDDSIAQGFPADTDTNGYAPHEKEVDNETPENSVGNYIPGSSASIIFPTGVLKLPELIGLLDALPIDVTFVDKNDTVKYFSQGRDRIFARTKTIIGRSVSNCHPPASVHVVEKLLADFKSGKKDSEDFWIKMGEKYVLIRYYAVRDEKGDYLGTLEVTQDIAPIQAIVGQKRI